MPGKTSAALDLIYDSVDDLLRKGNFDQLDSMLAAFPIAELSVDMLLGILTATLPAKSRLPSRGKLFKEIEKTLKERNELEEGLLTGLEG
jgi:hypothetical protein